MAPSISGFLERSRPSYIPFSINGNGCSSPVSDTLTLGPSPCFLMVSLPLHSNLIAPYKCVSHLSSQLYQVSPYFKSPQNLSSRLLNSPQLTLYFLYLPHLPFFYPSPASALLPK